MQGLNYFADHDSSKFKQYENTDSTRLNADDCYIKLRNNDNTKKLKYFTSNHVDLLKAKEHYNFFGIDVQDGMFVPGAEIDSYSNLLNGSNGQTMTNKNIKNTLGPLPIHSSFRGQVSRGDTTIESDLKMNGQFKKNACIQRDPNYIDRQYSIFTGIEVPDATKSVESPKNGFSMGRVGLPSRFDENRFA